jgi:hypothetical protein
VPVGLLLPVLRTLDDAKAAHPDEATV